MVVFGDSPHTKKCNNYYTGYVHCGLHSQAFYENLIFCMDKSCVNCKDAYTSIKQTRKHI